MHKEYTQIICINNIEQIKENKDSYIFKIAFPFLRGHYYDLQFIGSVFGLLKQHWSPSFF